MWKIFFLEYFPRFFSGEFMCANNVNLVTINTAFITSQRAACHKRTENRRNEKCFSNLNWLLTELSLCECDVCRVPHTQSNLQTLFIHFVAANTRRKRLPFASELLCLLFTAISAIGFFSNEWKKKMIFSKRRREKENKMNKWNQQQRIDVHAFHAYRTKSESAQK